MSTDLDYVRIWDRKASFAELSAEIHGRMANASSLINQLINFDQQKENILREDLKKSIKSYFDSETRDELLTRDRFYLALGHSESDLRYFVVYYLQYVGEMVDEESLWSYNWVQNFENAYFD